MSVRLLYPAGKGGGGNCLEIFHIPVQSDFFIRLFNLICETYHFYFASIVNQGKIMGNRREIFAGNWKMNLTRDGAVGLVKTILSGAGNIKEREIVVFPPSPYVREISDMVRGSAVSTGMQNMYFEKEGAFTGEVSPMMVKDCGCRYILIGHSERRHVFGETDRDVARKVRAALDNGLDPMICVGELLEEREKGMTRTIVKNQTVAALDGLNQDELKRVVIAYEPVWAIGTGRVATPDTAQEVHAFIREVMADMFNRSIADVIPVLYGGSVKADNIAGLYKMKDIDGVLVGGASLVAQSFLDIIRVE